MPSYPFNNVATVDAYTDAGTCVFPRPATSFSMQVFNATIAYTLLMVGKNGLQVNAYQPDQFEHLLAPSFTNFDESDLPGGMAFAGVMVRSFVPATPARVTVS